MICVKRATRANAAAQKLLHCQKVGADNVFDATNKAIFFDVCKTADEYVCSAQLGAIIFKSLRCETYIRMHDLLRIYSAVQTERKSALLRRKLDHWNMRCSVNLCEHVDAILKQALLRDPINADETPVFLGAVGRHGFHAKCYTALCWHNADGAPMTVDEFLDSAVFLSGYKGVKAAKFQRPDAAERVLSGAEEKTLSKYFCSVFTANLVHEIVAYCFFNQQLTEPIDVLNEAVTPAEFCEMIPVDSDIDREKLMSLLYSACNAREREILEKMTLPVVLHSPSEIPPDMPLFMYRTLRFKRFSLQLAQVLMDSCVASVAHWVTPERHRNAYEKQKLSGYVLKWHKRFAGRDSWYNTKGERKHTRMQNKWLIESGMDDYYDSLAPSADDTIEEKLLDDDDDAATLSDTEVQWILEDVSADDTLSLRQKLHQFHVYARRKLLAQSKHGPYDDYCISFAAPHQEDACVLFFEPKDRHLPSIWLF